MPVLYVVVGVVWIAIGVQRMRQSLVILAPGWLRRLPGIIAEPQGRHRGMTSFGTRQSQWQALAVSVIFIFEGLLMAIGVLGHGVATRVLLIVSLACLVWILAGYIAGRFGLRKQGG